MNKVIALVGMCGAGKSVVTEYYKQKGYFSVYFGGITMDELKRRNMEITPDNEKLVKEELRVTHGMAAYAILSLPKIEAGLIDGPVIIDGLYSWTEYKVLKEKFGEDFFVVAVYAPPAMRYERLATRSIRPINNADAKKRDYAEIENIEKGGPIAMADYTLTNVSDMDALLEQVAKLPF